mmetsp:Transcript_19418/g.44233  ORF Transcript_19418/g.44233 Transcript_19418/m.44233 type:complete len:202 (-) Transcript_19418:1096-1701(-)
MCCTSLVPEALLRSLFKFIITQGHIVIWLNFLGDHLFQYTLPFQICYLLLGRLRLRDAPERLRSKFRYPRVLSFLFFCTALGDGGARSRPIPQASGGSSYGISRSVSCWLRSSCHGRSRKIHAVSCIDELPTGNFRRQLFYAVRLCLCFLLFLYLLRLFGRYVRDERSDAGTSNREGHRRHAQRGHDDPPDQLSQPRHHGG